LTAYSSRHEIGDSACIKFSHFIIFHANTDALFPIISLAQLQNAEMR
jgi:hypothetical protein